MREWRKQNPDKAAAQTAKAHRIFRAKNPDYQRRYYAANPESERAKSIRYRRANPERHAATRRETRHRRRAQMDRNSKELTNLMAELVKLPCVYCGTVENITIDHVIPLSRGGKHEADNLAPACLPCNCSKGNLLPSEWSGRLAA